MFSASTVIKSVSGRPTISPSSKTSSQSSSSPSSPTSSNPTSTKALPSSFPATAFATGIPTLPPTAHAHKGASQAATIGVSVGVPVGCLLLALLLYLLYRERRTKRQIRDLQAHMQKTESQPRDQNGRNHPESGFHGDPKISGQWTHELETGPDRRELSGGNENHEMAGRPRWEM